MLTNQYPCEANAADEGWTVVQSGSSISLIDESLSGHGSKCLYDNDTGSGIAYMHQPTPAVQPGEWLAVSFYMAVFAGNWMSPFKISDSDESDSVMIANIHSKVWRIIWYSDDDSGVVAYDTYVAGQVYFVAMAMKRSSGPGVYDGEVKFSFNGGAATHVTDLLTYSNMQNKYFCAGYQESWASGPFKIDDIRVGNSFDDVLPNGVTPPTPADELPSRERTIVLFRQGDDDSKTLAQSLDIDDAMLCPLPCSSDETLSSYEDFQNEVENALQSFLAFRPSVAAQATCIIAGLNVPGYFYNTSNLHSTCGRLMNIDTAFAGAVANPLQGSAQRLTSTILQVNDMRLAARIDGSTLGDAQGLQVLGDGNFVVPESDKIFSSETATISQQKLRLEIKTLAGSTVEGDAIFYQHADASGVTFGDGGSRLSHITNQATDLTRDEIAYAMNDWGYSSFISFADDFDFDAFCEMLRIGGTIAEAFTVAVEKIDVRNQLAAWPLMTASVPKSGYDVFIAKGDTLNINYDSPSQYLHSSASDFSIELPQADDVYVISLRRVDSGGQSETRGRIIFLDHDDQGDYFQQLPQPFDLSVSNIDNGIRLGLTCLANQGQQQPAEIGIFEYVDGDVDLENPLAEIDVENKQQNEFFVELDIVRPISLVAIAKDSSGNIGHHSRVLILDELRKPVTPQPMED